MPFVINPSDTRPIYVQIMDEIRRAIVVGTFAPGDPLPSVRQLAGELRVNPNTVSQAYREMERDGLVYVQRGQGTFVGSERPLDVDRRALRTDVARRALLDANRHGLALEEFIDAIRDAAQAAADPARTLQP
ncbi:GntR family transcriptional regulator [Brevundimonas sp.]|uniref:GntR family transcriptional regulator n=1 Tax=Brevundimonas sp. TaxID=1871086 RepID=UPI003D0F9AF7